ncbi:hypothetical protein RvY_11207 [Ramazzottius varieornatus]|uniref:Uncharacterized protein n=1 Tax=Ramazzottius varieornatus TaxID=947166 RepID=A0A1D1VN43_RAMVA|nr:hypothetical protein RvY_11207 [Ramazzottius varieornatus]
MSNTKTDLVDNISLQLSVDVQIAAEKFIDSKKGALSVVYEDGTFGLSDTKPEESQGSKFIFDRDVTRNCRGTFFETHDRLDSFNQRPQ